MVVFVRICSIARKLEEVNVFGRVLIKLFGILFRSRLGCYVMICGAPLCKVEVVYAVPWISPWGHMSSSMSG